MCDECLQAKLDNAEQELMRLKWKEKVLNNLLDELHSKSFFLTKLYHVIRIIHRYNSAQY